MSQVKDSMGSIKRVVKMYIKQFPVLTWVVVACNIYNAVAAAMPAVFLQKVTAVLEQTIKTGDWENAKIQLVSLLIPLICIYALAAILSITQSQIQAYMTQKFLHNLRTDLFNKMQTLPLKYFDTHKHGDIMSHYTNDIDTLRQLVSMAIPTILRAGVVVISVFVIMLGESVKDGTKFDLVGNSLSYLLPAFIVLFLDVVYTFIYFKIHRRLIEKGSLSKEFIYEKVEEIKNRNK